MIKRKLLKTILFIAVCAFFFSNTYGQNKTILTLATRYSQALKKLENQKKRGNIKLLYRKGQAVAEKLDDLEALNETDYASVEKKMKGFVVNRDEVVFVKPDVNFYKKLSKIHGTKADIAFFNFLGELKPDSVWSAYIEQQTDYSGCTIYGNGKLTALYGKAKQFRKQFPAAYASDINEAINDIRETFTNDTCACRDSRSVVKEFLLFINAFPKDAITLAVRKRLAEIKENRTAFRFQCLSG